MGWSTNLFQGEAAMFSVSHAQGLVLREFKWYNMVSNSEITHQSHIRMLHTWSVVQVPVVRIGEHNLSL